MVKAVIKIMVVVVMILKTNPTPIPTAFLYLQNYGIPYHHLQNLVFLNTTTNTISIQPSKIMQTIFPKPSGINCPHAESAISKSQHCNKQQANSTTTHPNDTTGYSVADMLPRYASKSVHCTPMDIGPTSDSKILNSIMSSSCSTPSNMWSVNICSGDHIVHSNGSSYNVNMSHVTYWYLQAISDSIRSLIDGGANDGLASTDMHVLKYTEQCADITGVGEESINTLPLLTCSGTVHKTQGPVVLIMNQYAYYGKGSTVHSVGQVSHFGLDVDDQSSSIPAISNAWLHLIGGSFLSILLMD